MDDQRKIRLYMAVNIPFYKYAKFIYCNTVSTILSVNTSDNLNVFPYLHLSKADEAQ